MNPNRKLIFDKYGGRCAYCGCDLVKGWHVDELLPIVRCERYLTDSDGKRVFCDIKREYKVEKYLQYPERLNIDNQMPSCASCNIEKSSLPLNVFRGNIKRFINSLNQYHNQYKFAKRYGLVTETNSEVVFYFETLTPKAEQE